MGFPCLHANAGAYGSFAYEAFVWNHETFQIVPFARHEVVSKVNRFLKGDAYIYANVDIVRSPGSITPRMRGQNSGAGLTRNMHNIVSCMKHSNDNS